MSQLQSFTVNPGTSQSVQLVPQAIAIKVTNKSYYDIQYSDFGTMGQDWLAAGTEYLLDGTIENNGKLTLFPVNTDNITPALPGTVLINTYIEGEDLPNGTWPISVPKSTVSTVVSTTNALVNDGNAPGATILESTPSGQSGTPASAVELTNDGLLQLSVLIAGVLHQAINTNASGNLLQLANSGDMTEILGKLTVDDVATFLHAVNFNGTIGVSGNAQFGTINCGGGYSQTGGDLNMNGHNITNGGTIDGNFGAGGYTQNAGDMHLNTHHIDGVGQFGFNQGSTISAIGGGTFTPGSTSGTIAHNLGNVPHVVVISCAQNGSTSTCSASNWNASTFNFNVNSINIAYAWIAYRS